MRVSQRKPVVAWMSRGYPADPPKWVLSTSPYKQQLVADAGAVPFGVAGSNMEITNDTDLRSILSGVDILIDESYSPNTYTWQSFLGNYPLDDTVGVVGARQVWRLDGLVNPSGSSDWFAGAVSEADEVLRDMVGVVQAKLAAQSSWTHGTWLRRLSVASPIVAQSSGCSNALGAAPLLQGACTLASCQAVSDGEVDYFPDKVSVLYAQDFTVAYHGTYKTVINRKSGVNESYLLHPRGTPAPAGASGYKVFEIPLQAIAVEDTPWDLSFPIPCPSLFNSVAHT